MAPIASQRPANAEVVLQQLVVLESSGQSIPKSALNRSLESQPQVVIPPNTNSAGSSPIPETGSTGTQQPPLAPPSVDPIAAAPESATVPISTNTTSSIRPEFSQKCQKVLAEFIGPISAIVYQRTLTQHPNVTEQELVKLLSQHIPIAEQSTKFRQRFRS